MAISVDEDGDDKNSVAVVAATACGWTAVSNASWITITSGASAVGNGTVLFRVGANDGKDRTGTLTVAQQTVTVEQGKKKGKN